MISPDNPPFEFKDTAGGGKGVVGFDVDLIRMIADEMGKRIKIVEVDFPTLIQGVRSGRADMGISAIAATEERRKNVDFSDAYHDYNFAMLCKGPCIKDIGEMRKKKIGVQLGSTHEAKANSLVADHKVKVVSLNKLPELILQLKQGRVDMVMTQEVVAQNIMKVNPDLSFRVMDEFGVESSYIVFPKGSELVGEVNQAIAALKERGEIDALINKWFAN